MGGKLPVATPGAAIPRRRSRLLWSEARDGYLFIMPWLLGLLIFTAAPILASVALAFMDWELLTPPKWVGFDNITQIVRDPKVGVALYNTAYYTFLAVPLHLAFALAAALALSGRMRFARLYRTLWYLPSMLPAVASSVLWLWIFHPQFGLANAVLKLGGIRGPMWLFDEEWAKPAFIIMGLWGIGGAMVIFLAGLQGIPETLYEAAEIDGAGRLSRFRHVTLPMLTPVIFFNLVMGLIGSFQVFTAAYVMTKGGPGEATLFLVLYLYENGFQNFRMGYASALAWLLFIIIMMFTLIQLRLADRWVYYEGGLRDANGNG